MPITAITLDVDDTLWPFAPVAERIECALEEWLAEHAPRTAALFDRAAAHEAVAAVRRERADLAHDMGASRREALRRMLSAAGEDPGLSEGAFAVVYEARQRVELYPEAAEALDRLSERLPILGLTNGNADVSRIGLDRWLTGSISAMDVGVAKPEPAIFHLACERLGARPPEVLHAGDDLRTDVAGALEAGLQAAWVHRDLEGEVPPGVMRARDLRELADAVLAAA